MKRKTRSVSEMLGDFFREAAVLLLIFYPLDSARKENGNLSLSFVVLVGSASVVLLLMGIVFEKLGE